jgi:hypothetical protein
MTEDTQRPSRRRPLDSALRVFPMGACQLQWPLWPLARSGRIIQTPHRAGISEISCYTTAEASQRILFCREEFELPKSLYYYCALLQEVDPTAGKLRSVEDADVALLEPNSPICTYFGPYALNRGKLLPFLDVLSQSGADARRAANLWFTQGLLGCNKERVREGADFLIPLLPGRVEDVVLARELLLGMHGHRQDAEEYIASIAEIRDMLNLPLGLVAYIHRFLPDGRLLPWPPDHLENTLEAARRLGLPMFNPADTVLRHGVAKAINEHNTYRAEFRTVIAEPLYEFCLQTAGKATPAADPRVPAAVREGLADRLSPSTGAR